MTTAAGRPAPARPAAARPASVLILGSGPVVIGQAAEFDYAGTQACRALRAEGIRTILLNSNPATIMTDPSVADAIYLEPLTVEAVEAVIARERPDGLLAGLGGQTALNLAIGMADAGVFERHAIRLLGTPLEAIRMAEDREAFRDLLDRIGQPYAPSSIVEGTMPEARERSTREALDAIGLPAIVRPAYTLGGTGGGIVETEAAYVERVRAGLRASPIGQVMVERCLVGWQEIEYEVMRDADDTCIAVCSMENVDPLGVHTGDSIVVAPVQTLTDAVHQRLRSASLAIIRALGVEGGCNVQFALSPDSTDYAVIEVNPRVSRSSALASKATGYPIARVAAQIAIGRRLAEIPNVVTGTTVAAFEPALDYVVVKLPRFPFDKFPGADRSLGSQMKATGEVMAIDRTFGSALNLTMALAARGTLDRYNVRLLGTPLEAIEMAEDRERFRDLLDRIGQPYAPSRIVEGKTPQERETSADTALAEIGLPAIVRPAFTLGGTGGGIVETEPAYRERIRAGLRASPIGQVMVEKCLVGWQEIEYEVMRDADDTCIAVCSMENVDPLGVHTGDSIVVAPVQTLPDPVHQRLRSAALAIIRALGVEGGCNVQFALSPDSTDYAVIEVNPRVSRSSALASKATGYPIARVAAQIAVGRRLAEIPNVVTGTTVAAFEPALDYVVVKLPRFPFDKFPTADRTLGSQMKATGEVMAIDRTFGSALNKALRGLEQAGAGPLAEDPGWNPTFDYLAGVYAGDPETDEPIRWVDESGTACESSRHAQRTAAPIVLRRFLEPSDSRLWRLLGLLRRGVPEATIREATGIAPWFIAEMSRNVALEAEVRAAGATILDAAANRDGEAATLLATAKRAGFGDRELAAIAGVDEADLRSTRLAIGLVPGYAMVDTCAAEFAAETPYFYATYAAAGSAPEAPPVPRPAALVIGSGPVRIGQGIEFDYCAVQAAQTLRERGWSAVMINSNPETVSTDFDASTRLYFEPLDPESVRSVIDAETRTADGESPLPAVVAYGGQTPLNLAAPLAAAGVPLLGSDLEAIDQAEERTRFAALLDRLGIPQPDGGMAHSIEEALTLAERIGYPVIVRPSFVIGGLAIDFCYSPDDLVRQLAAATVVDPDRPVRVDRYLEGVEVDIDAVSDGERVLIPGLLEHVERAGVHSGDSVGMFPPQSVSTWDQELIVATMERIVLALGAKGLVNAQFIVRDDGVYLIEVNPRASRTVPFMSKVTGVPMVELAVRIALGETLADLGWPNGLLAPPPFVAVKAPAFSTAKLRGVDPSVGPGMQSTGEVIGIHTDPRVALAKALVGAALVPPRATAAGALALLSIADRDKAEIARLGAALTRAGYTLAATSGTRAALADAGFEAAPVAKLGAEPDAAIGEASILELIASGTVRLVVNTPTPRSGAVRDAAEIRHAATAEGILCLTAVETAVAAAEALDPAILDALSDVRPLGEWVVAGRVPEVVPA